MAETEKVPLETANAEQETTAEATAQQPSGHIVKSGRSSEGFAKAIMPYITAERIIGLIALLLIPCFFAAWVNLPITEKAGIKVEFSLPQTITMATNTVNTMEKAGGNATSAKQTIDSMSAVLGNAAKVAATVASTEDATPEERRAMLKDAAANLVDAVVDGEIDVSTAESEPDKADETIKAYTEAISMVKTILSAVSFVWYLFLLIIVVAGILLLGRFKGRYALGIIAFALIAIVAVAVVIGVQLADQLIVEAIAQSKGAWIVTILPSIVGTTAWPTITAVVSILCLVTLCVLLAKNRRQKKKLA